MPPPPGELPPSDSNLSMPPKSSHYSPTETTSFPTTIPQKTKILFLTTTHNSLSQRLHLFLSSSPQQYTISIEYALSPTTMIEAVSLFKPDLVICPFLTAKVPREIYEEVMTLIVHPGPPGDRGPSSLDWLILGEGDGEGESETNKTTNTPPTHWGVSIIQAVEKLDAGPIWAFAQFPINIDHPNLTKSTLYRGPITHCAIAATLVAIYRLEEIRLASKFVERKFLPTLEAKPEWLCKCIYDGSPFKGGYVTERPLLKAIDREFDMDRHTSVQISRRIRSGDSQPGAQSKIFGPSLYIYGGMIEDLTHIFEVDAAAQLRYKNANPGDIFIVRSGAVCIKTMDGKGVWITHTRRLKRKTDKALWPKVNAVFGLLELGILDAGKITKLELHLPHDSVYGNPLKYPRGSTFQEIWVDRVDDIDYVYFEFYNGAMSTQKCIDLLSELKWAIGSGNTGKDLSFLKEKTEDLLPPPRAIVIMGGSYFSNGIDLNTIEASNDPPQESWNNINAMDDLIEYILTISRDLGISTIAAPRGNAAAGGVALMAACDYVICHAEVVLNPAYRAIGLYGSEFHTISYRGRCGDEMAESFLGDMLPTGPRDTGGLVDDVYEGDSESFDEYVRTKVPSLLNDKVKSQPYSSSTDSETQTKQALWTSQPNIISPGKLKQARDHELGEMKKNFWGEGSEYHERRYDFVRKVVPKETPVRFAVHRAAGYDGKGKPVEGEISRGSHLFECSYEEQGGS